MSELEEIENLENSLYNVVNGYLRFNFLKLCARVPPFDYTDRRFARGIRCQFSPDYTRWVLEVLAGFKEEFEKN